MSNNVIFSINNFTLNENIDVINTIYAVIPSMNDSINEQPQQDVVSVQNYVIEIYNLVLGNAGAAAIQVAGLVEFGAYYAVFAAAVAVVFAVVVPDVIT